MLASCLANISCENDNIYGQDLTILSEILLDVLMLVTWLILVVINI